VIIEFPPILYHPYPIDLLSETDIPVLVCRSNRLWSDADQAALAVMIQLTDKKINFFLNGVEVPVIESVLGELPKKRSWMRRKIKNAFRFQFYTKNQL
jgi:hypothetical protein